VLGGLAKRIPPILCLPLRRNTLRYALMIRDPSPLP
jgi:hypothetical protein